MIQFFKDVYNGFINAKISRKILYSLLILIYLISILLVSIKVNYEAITPGRVSANISTKEYNTPNMSVYIDTSKSPGSIYTVGVYAHKPISLFQYLIGKFNGDIKFDEFNPKTDLSQNQEEQIGEKSKDMSVINAIIVAYTEAKKIDDKINLDYEYEGVLVALVYDYSKSDLKVDDVITHVNGIKVTSLTHFHELNNTINNEDYFRLTIIRDNTTREINTRKVYNDSTKKYLLGINAMDSYTIDEKTAFPKFVLHKNNSIGGSGGAMLTLSIYNALIEEDITNGKIIIGTGTISLDGKVGDIGGVSQKIVTAKLYNADVFFCNPEDYEEAKAKALEIEAEFEVIRVEEFIDILDYLKGEENE